MSDVKKIEPGLDKLAAHEAKKEIAASPKYKIRSAADILKQNPEPPLEIWGGITLTNDVFEIIGASGIGKSRIILNLALTQALADKGGLGTFAGLPTHRGPLKWLLLGTENGLYRLYSDLSKMTQFCTEEQLEALGERLFLSTLEGDGDNYMAVDDENNINKLKATIAEVKPDIVVFDPWGDICGGSELDDKVVRETIAKLRNFRWGVKNQMPIIIVNHARMGALENFKSTGLDAANFGKNSKALYTISRTVWNLYHASLDPTEGMVGMYNAKRSNGKPYDERCVRLNPEQMSYSFVEGYDPKATRAQMTAAASCPKQNREEVRGEKHKAEMEKGVKAGLAAVECGKVSLGVLKSVIKDAGVSSRGVDEVLGLLQDKYGLEKEVGLGKHAKTFWGTREQIAALRKAKEEVQK